jgi:hypothetical protein
MASKDAGLYEMLTENKYKDGIFSAITGYLSNQIDDILFSDSRNLRSSADNNSTYAEAVIFKRRQEDSCFDKHKRDLICSHVTRVYERVFSGYITFLAQHLRLFKFRDLVPSTPLPPKNYNVFTRILQFPYNIRAVTFTNRVQVRGNTESHEDSSTKLSHTVDEPRYFNVKLYKDSDAMKHYKTFMRADGGIFMAVDEISNVTNPEQHNVLRSPYSYPARQAMDLVDPARMRFASTARLARV